MSYWVKTCWCLAHINCSDDLSQATEQALAEIVEAAYTRLQTIEGAGVLSIAWGRKASSGKEEHDDSSGVRLIGGEECQAVADSTGKRCQTRAFALLRVSHRNSTSELWLCGNHQRRFRDRGATLELIRKWSQGTQETE